MRLGDALKVLDMEGQGGVESLGRCLRADGNIRNPRKSTRIPSSLLVLKNWSDVKPNSKIRKS
jgi:hypothetical protein